MTKITVEQVKKSFCAAFSVDPESDLTSQIFMHFMHFRALIICLNNKDTSKPIYVDKLMYKFYCIGAYENYIADMGPVDEAKTLAESTLYKELEEYPYYIYCFFFKLIKNFAVDESYAGLSVFYKKCLIDLWDNNMKEFALPPNKDSDFYLCRNFAEACRLVNMRHSPVSDFINLMDAFLLEE